MLAAARRMALLQRGQNADRHVHAGAGIADRRVYVGRRVVGEAGDAHRPAHRLRDRLEALEITVGPIGAKALYRGIDEAWIDLGKNVLAEPQPVEGTRPKVLNQHV
jgi:hypothetical protein